MTTPLPDDQDYPYRPHTAAARAVEVELRRSYSPFFWRWFYRCFVAGTALSLITALTLGILCYRIAFQSSLVADLERRGCSIRYENIPVVEDTLPRFLRDWFGDHWWSDVTEVSHWTFGFRSETSSADDLNAICQACAALPKLKSFTIHNPHFSFRQI